MTDSSISVPISTEQFITLVDFLRDQGSDRDPVRAVAIAIDYWIDNASWKQEDLMPELATKDKGFNWKNVFMPHGTRIRMKYSGDYYYAQVNGDYFEYENEVLSPNEFAKKVSNGVPKNAWAYLEIRRPNDDEWIPANTLRKSVPSSIDKIIKESKLYSQLGLK